MTSPGAADAAFGGRPFEPAFRPFDAVLAWYFVTVGALVLLFAREVPHSTQGVLLHAGGALAALLLPVAARALPAWGALAVRFVLAYLLVFVAFRALGGIVEFVSPDDREWHLIALDRRIFGTDPTRALGAVASPALTELLQVVYASFYLLPVVLGLALARAGKWRAFEFCLTAVALGFLLSYLGYLLVPARGPERFLPHDRPLEGIAAAAGLRLWIDRVEPIKRDCFPSGHAEVSFLVAALAWRFHRPAFRLLGPVAALLAFSTVYLRYHYAVDVLAGAALAAGTLLATGRLMAPVRG
ncbi:MAG TPA: phosphatase PAP2 family protein [Planctomycetota bacterium]|nr:phosphatase PAP2 family protein [Planctomycetota bacterium]